MALYLPAASGSGHPAGPGRRQPLRRPAPAAADRPALADRPEILILDNADSALDYSTAAALRQALRRDFPCTTLVIISERVSAVREADCILVLENGRIDAQGCHDALMAPCRRYQRMAKLQMGGDVG